MQELKKKDVNDSWDKGLMEKLGQNLNIYLFIIFFLFIHIDSLQNQAHM